jgi:hypothetical protein
MDKFDEKKERARKAKLEEERDLELAKLTRE